MYIHDILIYLPVLYEVVEAPLSRVVSLHPLQAQGEYMTSLLFSSQISRIDWLRFVKKQVSKSLRGSQLIIDACNFQFDYFLLAMSYNQVTKQKYYARANKLASGICMYSL